MQKIIDAIDGTVMNIFNLLTIETPAIKKAVSSGHIIIIVLVSIAIMLSIVTIIRQQKIMRKLDELTKEAPQILEKGDINHAE